MAGTDENNVSMTLEEDEPVSSVSTATVSSSQAVSTRKSTRVLQPASMVLAVALIAISAAAFFVSRHVTQANEAQLVSLEATDARSTLTALVSQLESSLESVGAVAAATGGSPQAITRLIHTEPSLAMYSAIAVLKRLPGGTAKVVIQSGAPSIHLPNPGKMAGTNLGSAIDHGGFDIVGTFAHAASRKLAMAVGPPEVPGGYVIYAEFPLPHGRTISSGFPHLNYAVYVGTSQRRAGLLLATTRRLPLGGQQRTTFINLDNPSATSGVKPGPSTLRFVVSSTSSPVGPLGQMLPWILLGAGLLIGLLAVVVVETTARRREVALGLVSDLELKNEALDRALADQHAAQKAKAHLEDELRQSQRLEAVGQLAGGVAHDFNNLLAVIRTYNDFIGEELGEHPLQADVAEVRKATTRAAELTRKLLIFSRREMVQPHVLDVDATIADVAGFLRRTLPEDIHLELSSAPDLPAVIADPGEIEQMLVNLVVNARDAINGAGTIHIETSLEVLDSLSSNVHADAHQGCYVRIMVSDSGSGMTQEVADRVFEPFFTTKGPGAGTGLGLSTVYGIVRRLEGFVTMYTEPGIGTTFKIYLPCTEDQPSELRQLGSVPGVSVGHGRILLVEDEEAVRAGTKRILERAGYDVLEAADAAQAIELHGRQGPVDLLLSDVIMPGKLSGPALATELARAQPRLKVLFMSGYSGDLVTARGLLNEGVNLIEKPFSAAILLSKVEEALS